MGLITFIWKDHGYVVTPTTIILYGKMLLFENAFGAHSHAKIGSFIIAPCWPGLKITI